MWKVLHGRLKRSPAYRRASWRQKYELTARLSEAWARACERRIAEMGRRARDRTRRGYQ